jgi:hypothetical protein
MCGFSPASADLSVRCGSVGHDGIDFGKRRVPIGDTVVPVYLFMATLG